MRRLILLSPALALAAALLLALAGPALSKVLVGDDDPNTLIGTKRKDLITGGGGEDLLKGRAGNDSYIFDDNWGTDILVEPAKRGIDTLDFRSVSSGKVTVNLTPEWVSVNPNNNSASGPGGEVQLAYQVNGNTVQSIVENVIGGQGEGDSINGGRERNVLQPGGGGADLLLDFGGHDDGDGPLPPIPVSNDVYKGFADNSGIDQIFDYGGQGDVLDLRPFKRADVSLNSFDFDTDPETEESLEIVTSESTSVVVLGQFGDYQPYTSDFGYHGHIETIIFADRKITDTSVVQLLAVASTEATSAKQAKLAAASEGLTKDARALLDPSDLTGPHPTTDGTARAEADRSDRQQKHHKQHQSRKRR
jgi:hypothetical protein